MSLQTYVKERIEEYGGMQSFLDDLKTLKSKLISHKDIELIQFLIDYYYLLSKIPVNIEDDVRNNPAMLEDYMDLFKRLRFCCQHKIVTFYTDILEAKREYIFKTISLVG